MNKWGFAAEMSKLGLSKESAEAGILIHGWEAYCYLHNLNDMVERGCCNCWQLVVAADTFVVAEKFVVVAEKFVVAVDMFVVVADKHRNKASALCSGFGKWCVRAYLHCSDADYADNESVVELAP